MKNFKNSLAALGALALSLTPAAWAAPHESRAVPALGVEGPQAAPQALTRLDGASAPSAQAPSIVETAAATVVSADGAARPSDAQAAASAAQANAASPAAERVIAPADSSRRTVAKAAGIAAALGDGKKDPGASDEYSQRLVEAMRYGGGPGMMGGSGLAVLYLARQRELRKAAEPKVDRGQRALEFGAFAQHRHAHSLAAFHLARDIRRAASQSFAYLKKKWSN